MVNKVVSCKVNNGFDLFFHHSIKLFLMFFKLDYYIIVSYF